MAAIRHPDRRAVAGGPWHICRGGTRGPVADLSAHLWPARYGGRCGPRLRASRGVDAADLHAYRRGDLSVPTA